MTDSFWNNYRILRQHFKGKTAADVRREKNAIRFGPMGIFASALDTFMSMDQEDGPVFVPNWNGKPVVVAESEAVA